MAKRKAVTYVAYRNPFKKQLMRRIYSTRASRDAFFELYCLRMCRTDCTVDSLTYWYNLVKEEELELRHLYSRAMFY
jgi:hypothetical protein